MSKTLRGLQKTLQNIERLKKDLEIGASNGVELAANKILAKSQEIVPVQTGNLASSGSVEVDGSQARVVYTAPYALDVHERQESSGYKFLESAVQDVDVEKEVAQVLRAAVKRS